MTAKNDNKISRHRLDDDEVEKGIAKYAKDHDASIAEATRRLAGVGLVRLRALSDYAAKQEQKRAMKGAKVKPAAKPKKVKANGAAAAAKRKANYDAKMVKINAKLNEKLAKRKAAASTEVEQVKEAN